MEEGEPKRGSAFPPKSLKRKESNQDSRKTVMKKLACKNRKLKVEWYGNSGQRGKKQSDSIYNAT